jgi:DNA repair exonuclease SbcCD nuclease subunit
MFKFIHAADLHLDSPLHGLERYEGAPVEEIRGATRRALDNLVQLAIDEQVQFVLIAGDLYDGNWRDHNTGLFFVSRITKLRNAGIAVYAISGNHDATSKMTRSLSLPANPDGSPIMLSDKKPETIVIEPRQVAIHGQGFARATVEENVVPNFPAARPGYFNIGMLHTSLDLETGGEHARYAPCSLTDLATRGYQYWALGHVHQRSLRGADPIVAFPGNLQGRHIREAGAKGCWLVTVDASHRAQPEFRATDVMRWVTCDVSAEEAQCPDDIVAMFASRLSAQMAADDSLPLAVRVRVTGRSEAHQKLLADLPGLEGELRAKAIDVGGGSVWVEKIRLETSPPSASLDSGLLDGPLGEIMSLVGELVADEDQLRQLGDSLEDLDRKLPADLTTDEDKLRLRDPAELRRALDEVKSLLLARLEPQDARA